MKKRTLFGFPVFILAFLIGYSVVPIINAWKSHSLIRPVEEWCVDRTIPPAPLPETVPRTEFTDLPNFSEMEYPTGDNFIDIFENDGIYRESEVVAKTGESWLTLIERNGKYSLVKSVANVRTERSSSDTGDESYVRLKFDQPGTPIFAARNLRTLKPGPITTLYHRPAWKEIERRNLPIDSMGAGFSRAFDLGENRFRYILRVSKGLTRDGTQVSVLVLENGPILQVVAENYGETIGELYWVGDLDNDGKLDLYFDEDNEKGYFRGKLFLSSEAEHGKLVKMVATFDRAGC